MRQFQYLVSEDELGPEVLALRQTQRETEVGVRAITFTRIGVILQIRNYIFVNSRMILQVCKTVSSLRRQTCTD